MTAVAPPAVPQARIDKLRDLAQRLVSDEWSLGGRWAWFGQDRTPYIATRQRGRQIVLMLTGNATVRGREPGDTVPWMRKPQEIPVYEVAPDATSPRDKRVYRRDIIGLRSPVAEWLVEADPDTVLALVDEVTALRELVAGLTCTGGITCAGTHGHVEGCWATTPDAAKARFGGAA